MESDEEECLFEMTVEPECTIEEDEEAEIDDLDKAPEFEFVAGGIDTSSGENSNLTANFYKETTSSTAVEPLPKYSVGLPSSSKKNGESGYECTVCHKVFGLKGNLMTHMKIHSGEKPFRCEFCGRAFTMKCSWQRHLLLHADERPLYDCNICKKSFSQKYHLSVHMRSHTGEKPYKCDYCERKFSQKGNLDVHVRSHKGEFECEVCQVRCSSEYVLTRHMFIHTGVRPYACEYCEWSFAQIGTLRRHTKRAHKHLIGGTNVTLQDPKSDMVISDNGNIIQNIGDPGVNCEDFSRKNGVLPQSLEHTNGCDQQVKEIVPEGNSHITSIKSDNLEENATNKNSKRKNLSFQELVVKTETSTKCFRIIKMETPSALTQDMQDSSV